MVKAPDGSISDPPFTRENMLPYKNLAIVLVTISVVAN